MRLRHWKGQRTCSPQQDAVLYTPDKEFRVCCVVSKRYENTYQLYWYAFHPKWDQFLSEGCKESFFILSCMDRDDAFAIPYSWLLKNKENLSKSDEGDRSYWHVPIVRFDGDRLAIRTIAVRESACLSEFL